MTPQNQAAAAKTSQESREADVEADDFDWDLDFEERKDDMRRQTFQRVLRAFRSAFLCHLLENGLPNEQRAIFYFLMIEFHEDLDPPVQVYSAFSSVLLSFFPWFSPRILYSITRGFDVCRRSRYMDAKDMLIPPLSQAVFSALFAALIDFRGATTLLEYIFGPATKWSAALLPIFPGIFLRFVNEKPNSINGFLPENKQGIVVAIFA